MLDLLQVVESTGQEPRPRRGRPAEGGAPPDPRPRGRRPRGRLVSRPGGLPAQRPAGGPKAPPGSSGGAARLPCVAAGRAVRSLGGLAHQTLDERSALFGLAGALVVQLAEGVNARAIMEAMGHASITMTFDHYGHLMPNGRAEAARLVDAYLAGAGQA